VTALTAAHQQLFIDLHRDSGLTFNLHDSCFAGQIVVDYLPLGAQEAGSRLRILPVSPLGSLQEGLKSFEIF
jgi:hypothetical protein